jgi:thiamine biosynthesis lipoprotein
VEAFEWSATGTRWRIYHDGRIRPAVAERVAAAVARDEARWSRFRADSELSQVNRRAGEPVEVSGETLALAEACVQWHDATDGVFQPLVGEALRAWGYDSSYAERAPGAATSPAPAAITATLDVDLVARTVTVPVGSSLDVGGIGKVWIAARAARAIAVLAPLGDLLLDAGGDLVAVRGEHIIAVESGGAVRLAAGEGIATSGDGRRRWRNADGVEAHHLIDPATGAPGPSGQATVIAPDPVAADVWAKVLALRPERLDDLALPALVLAGDAPPRATPAWHAR